MVLPRRALIDPSAQEFDFMAGEPEPGFGRRHAVFRERLGDAKEQLALVVISRNNRMDSGRDFSEDAFVQVESQVGLAGGWVGAVALEAVVGENGTDISSEVDRLESFRLHRGREQFWC